MTEREATRTEGKIRQMTLWLNDVKPLDIRGWTDFVFIYAIVGLVGTIHETIWTYLVKGVFEYRNGSILTPFNYVYGLAALAIVFVLRRAGQGWKIFTIGGLCGGALEFAMSLFQQYVMGSRSWDYSKEPLNIAGRTTVPFMLFWGLLCYVIIRFIIPLMLSAVHLIPEEWGNRLATGLLAWILIDAAITLPAIFLYGQRADGVTFDNWYAQGMTLLFNDDFMRLHFPNMLV